MAEPRSHVMGRRKDNDISINTPEVSGKHLYFEFQGEQWIARRMDKNAATAINGVPMDGKQEIDKGDRISIGDFEFMVTRAEKPEFDPEKTWRLSLDSLS